MIFDLHTHSTASDGKLDPLELIQNAIDNKVDVLSITDHDTLDAYQNKNFEQYLSKNSAIKIIPGIELSAQWHYGKSSTGIHIVGLNVDLNNEILKQGVKQQQLARQQRAEIIAAKLEKNGLANALAGAQKYAKNNLSNGIVTRPHFAQYLIEMGFCKTQDQAFKKYLGGNKLGDINRFWASVPEVVSWIIQSGGVAVLAHPNKYNFTRTKLLKLLSDFKEADGEAMDVLSGNQSPHITQNLSQICQQQNLLASLGSDFHDPTFQWGRLGMHQKLPKGCAPVWDKF